MCGIVGIVGAEKGAQLVLQGLDRLKYRGYDSAGIATLDKGQFYRERAEGKLEGLEAKLKDSSLPGKAAIGHTRWATHGLPIERNAHPHMEGDVAVVHNGIIENFAVLRKELERQGDQFSTETDTEVVIHLLNRALKRHTSLKQAVLESVSQLKGAYALGILIKNHPDSLIAIRQGPPLVIGYGAGSMWIASDVMAFNSDVEEVSYLEDGQWAILTPSGVEAFDDKGSPITLERHRRLFGQEIVGKGVYRHFMQKEIFEQPIVLAETLQGYVHPLEGKVSVPLDLSGIERISIIACGTSFYAGMVARYWVESLSGVRVDFDIASEFRYRDVQTDPHTLFLFISQSGETADTLAALMDIKSKGGRTAAIVNVPGSTIARTASAVLLTHAGPEIGVASTKAFTCQLGVLAILALAVAQEKGRPHPDKVAELQMVPGYLHTLLEQVSEFLPMAEILSHARDVLFIGRNVMYPIALEGALKLKEISYIHAEGYAAGELKHGPIALIDEQVPVVVFSPSTVLKDKTLSNAHEIEARKGNLLVIGDEEGLEGMDHHKTFRMPTVSSFLAPFLYVIPAQVLAYETAVLKGTDVDQPRNLAKSVTVE